MRCIEERVTILDAESFEEAIEKGEAEAIEYASRTGGERFGYINCYMAKEYSEDLAINEVYSLLRQSNLEADDYLDFYEDSGSNRSQSEGDERLFDLDQFMKDGLKSLSPARILRIHILRFNGLGYPEVARLVFKDMALYGDEVVADRLQEELSHFRI